MKTFMEIAFFTLGMVATGIGLIAGMRVGIHLFIEPEFLSTEFLCRHCGAYLEERDFE